MHRIPAALAGCSLVAGLLTATPPVSAAPGAVGARGAGSYVRIAAKRVLATRSGVGGYKGLVSPGHTATFKVASAAAWQAAVLDVTVPTPAPAGSLSVYPSGTT